ncbi:hypothetical protein I3843_02G137700 [Carya illinoinensis]|uniref:Mediator complex subunit 15 KIX domain-containing protein n=1 Tax=Carya illinoinensis TaxID=32201 RepID=A0A922K696_CARIL|nr:hypothetical protein I3760_02G159700 [Carya illinoinensis]KAG6728122.1 hypothetical protein I3842_02G157100 [Carya illinoinensis]KAG7992666.1 hypothetical protein I3843_02G137700 [Carya illinoinensis]
MDANNWRPTTGQGPVGGGIGGGRGAGEPTMDSGDWRTGLPPDSRQRIVSKIMDTLKRHLPVSGQEGLHELRKIAVRFEEKIFTAATSQGDYLRKISLKMLTVETKSQNPLANSLPSNSAGNGNRPPDLEGHHPSDEDNDSEDDEFYYHSQDEVSEEADGPPPTSSPDNSTGNYGQ